MMIIAAVNEDGWYWGPGDPYLSAYLLTGYYLLLGAAALGMAYWLRRKAKHSAATESSSDPPSTIGKSGELWFLIGVLLLALGLNKQLDLQSLIPYWGRELFNWLGIYETRRIFQAVFFLVFLVVGLGLGLKLFWRIRVPSIAAALAWLGLGLQGLFVVFRAATINHMESQLWMSISQLSLNSVIEALGLFVLNAAIIRQVFELRNVSRDRIAGVNE